MLPRRSSGRSWLDPRSWLIRVFAKSTPITRAVIRQSAVRGRRSNLLSRRLRATGTRIGRATQSILGYGDQLGRGLPHRFDNRVPPRLQACDNVFGKAMFDPSLI